MNILFILPYVPYPLDSGGNQAFFSMVDKIRATHRVSLLLYLHNHGEQRAVAELKKVWSDVKLYCYEDPSIGCESYCKSLQMSKADGVKFRMFDSLRRSMERKKRRIVRRYEKPHKSAFTLPAFVHDNSTLFRNAEELTPQFCDFVFRTSREGFDLIQVEFYEFLPLVSLFPAGVKTVFVHHELRFVRNRNEMDLFAAITPYDELVYHAQKDAELAQLGHYSQIIVLTDVDRQILLQENPRLNIYTSPAITTTGEMAYKNFVPATELVFIGSGNHFPNADALLWYCTEVVPILRRQQRHPKLNVMGVWSRDIQNVVLKIDPEISFTGFVDDLQTFVNGKISIVPVRIGSGMRMKIIDTIAAAAPLLTTAKGCEGLPLASGQDCIIADTAADFAAGVIRLLDATDLQQSLVEAAQTKLSKMFDATAMLQRRLDFYKE